MSTVNVRVDVKQDGTHKVTIQPSRLRVPNGSANVTITWNAMNGTTFLPNPSAFEWIVGVGVPDPPVVTRVDDTKLQSAPYSNDFGSEVVWEYMIGVQKNGVRIQVDPEVDNDPPRP